jgi:hypothetical protein
MRSIFFTIASVAVVLASVTFSANSHARCAHDWVAAEGAHTFSIYYTGETSTAAEYRMYLKKNIKQLLPNPSFWDFSADRYAVSVVQQKETSEMLVYLARLPNHRKDTPIAPILPNEELFHSVTSFLNNEARTGRSSSYEVNPSLSSSSKPMRWEIVICAP